MDALQEWDFEKFSESAAKKALNHNIKHVMKEGGRAGKALMINTDKLISTVQVLGAAGGAAKAVQAISVTTGVMSALFLALDVFFLARDSHELRKGAKTKFAAKIREVCKDLQDGLLELNKVKTQLQRTMDGIEVEEYEEIQEVEVEVEDDLESDPVKLAELEQELDFIEEKLDKKAEEERKRKDEEERKKKEEEERKQQEEEAKAAKEKLQEESDNEEGDDEIEVAKSDAKRLKSEKETRKSDEEKSEQGVYSVKESIKEFFKDPILKVTKKDKDIENKITADKEKSTKKTHKKEASWSGDEILSVKGEGGPKSEKSKKKKDGETKSEDKVSSQSAGEIVQDVAKGANNQKVPWKNIEANKDDSAKQDEKYRFKSLKDMWTVKQENAEDKLHAKSLKEPPRLKETLEDDKVRSLRESWLAKEHEIRMEALATPRENLKVHEGSATQEGKVTSPSWRVESAKSHHSSGGKSESDRSSFKSDRSKPKERRESHRSHHDAGERMGQEGPREKGDEAERGTRRSHRESGRSHGERRKSHRESDKDIEAGNGQRESRRGHRESARGHREGDNDGESGRSHGESGRGERESRRSHRESDRRREEDGGSRPRSNAVLDDGLYI